MAEQSPEEAQAEAIAQYRSKHEAYLALFGAPGAPTPLGAVVLADLDGFCTTWKESIHLDKTGRIDPYATIYRDGKKAVALRIRQWLEWSEHDDSSSDSDER